MSTMTTNGKVAIVLLTTVAGLAVGGAVAIANTLGGGVGRASLATGLVTAVALVLLLAVR